MNVLVCGATGCIGSAVCAALEWRGHRVVRAARRVPDADPAPASADALRVDFTTPRTPAQWSACLTELRIDAIVNAVGVLIASPAVFDRIHRAGPLELFEGARLAGVGRVVQVSALGADAATPRSPYLYSKRAADEALPRLGLDAAIVRPSLVFGPRSASARLFARLATLPVIGLPGRGAQRLQPIHVLEVAEAIASLVERSGAARGVYELGGGAVVSYRQMLAAYRTALGLGPAIWLSVPLPLMRLAARLAELLPQRVFSRDTLDLLERGNVTLRNATPVLLGRPPSTLDEGLAVTPPRVRPDAATRRLADAPSRAYAP